MTQLTTKQKQIASDCYGYCVPTEYYKTAMLKARGHYWVDSDNEQYVAISLTGRRKYFVYNFYSTGRRSEDWGLVMKQKEWKKCARLGAFLWAKGKYKASRLCDKMNWDSYRNYYI